MNCIYTDYLKICVNYFYNIYTLALDLCWFLLNLLEKALSPCSLHCELFDYTHPPPIDVPLIDYSSHQHSPQHVQMPK
jgi:hypothetical protein